MIFTHTSGSSSVVAEAVVVGVGLDPMVVVGLERMYVVVKGIREVEEEGRKVLFGVGVGPAGVEVVAAVVEVDVDDGVEDPEAAAHKTCPNWRLLQLASMAGLSDSNCAKLIEFPPAFSF